MTCRLLLKNLATRGWWKSRASVCFWLQKSFFDSKHPKHLDKLNNSSKNQNQLEPKNIPVVKFALQARIRKKKTPR